jgi:hypothetical protein
MLMDARATPPRPESRALTAADEIDYTPPAPNAPDF